MGKEIVAMLLAGGKGTRLEALTRKSAKPAVSFGGKYRIIDFPMSNCANSKIDTVGVLTQYESVFLNSYIGNGEKWGLNGVRSLTAILPPRQTEAGANWFKGTADAIYQNLDFLETHNPEYVLILSGDHIYKMDYSLMLDYHKAQQSDLTVAVINVSIEEARRFGIMDVDGSFKITKFSEKPAKPSSTLASMGIYIFTYGVLKKALIEDAFLSSSEHDFGKNIIPTLLQDGRRLFAYPFNGYWKDVGTIESLWAANMDLLADTDAVGIYNSDLKIFTEDTHSVPQYVGKKSRIKNSIVNQGAIILGELKDSVVFNEVVIESGAKVANSVLMPGAFIKKGAKLNYVIVADNTVVEGNTEVDGGSSITLIAR